MRQVVILGASGHARVIADIVRICGDEVKTFLDDDISIKGVSGPIEDYKKYPDCEFVVGIGNTKIRERVSALPVKWYTAIHPTAVISPDTSIGVGTVIMPNAVINTGARIGAHCIINTGAIVEHDNIIGDYTHVSVGAKLGGTVHIGNSVWIGIGATVSNNIDICDECIIGAGAVVVKNIDTKGKYAGVPAKYLG